MRILLAVALLAVASCTSSGPTGPEPADNEIRVGANFFSPSSRTVVATSTITWTWNSGAGTHNVTFADGPTAGNQSSGTYDRTCNATGTFSYQCTIHGPPMSGTITVTDPVVRAASASEER